MKKFIMLIALAMILGLGFSNTVKATEDADTTKCECGVDEETDECLPCED